MSAIIHRPAGRGHAYRPSLAQRLPVHPVADDPIRLGALTPASTEELHVEVEVDGVATELRASPGPLVEVEDGDRGDGGHLAAAAAAGEDVGDALAWHVDLGSFPAGTRLAYRWRTGDRTSRWERCVVASWETGGGALTVDTSDGAAVADRLIGGSLRWLIADGQVLRARFSLRLHPDEHLVGLGERFHALDQRGWRVDTKVFEQYKHQHTRTYLPVPFLLVVGAGPVWGLHVDTTRRCWWDLGASDPDLLTVEVACDPDADTPEVVLRSYAAGAPAGVLSAFWRRSGHPVPAPSWALRPWISGNEWNTQERVVREVSRSLDEGIPVGVLVIEAWADEATFTCFRDAAYDPHPDGAAHRLEDFTFPADGAWPDPVGMVEWLHEQDVKVLLWQIPLLPEGVDDPQLRHDREALVTRGFAVAEEDGTPYRNRGWWFPGALLPDLTDPDCVQWWIDKRRYLVEQLGIDGFKTDGGEHAWGDELRYGDGSRGDVTNDRYPNLYAGAYHRLLEEGGRDGVTFSRAGSTGAGAVPCHWAGDEDSTWDAYRAAIAAGLTAGVSGVVYWGWDHGGFSGEIPSAELYLRTAAQACFSPIMQYHAEYNHHRQPNRDRTPWNIAERTGDARVVATYRRLAVLRERLVDEIDRQARRGLEVGLPLMRALCLAWPDDAEIWHWPQQYLLGDDLLVAPVTEPGVDRWTMYVPGDRWIDPWTSAVHTGPATVELAAPLDQPPVLVRATASERLLPLFAGLPDGSNGSGSPT
ncbi:MAG: glycoside hydrolase family 31 [Nitriliruptor sp.]|nr:MAG: glycoside hydrolase family 31 [Nitriliruptor sp.]